MDSRPLHSVTRIWLACSLLTNAVGAHSFSHRHAGGHEAHAHHAHAAIDGEHGHGHAEHSHHGHASPEQAADDAIDALAGAGLHAHLCLLGFELSLPLSDESRHEDQTAEAFLRLGPSRMNAPSIERHLAAVELLLLHGYAIAANSDVTCDWASRIDHAQISTPPLCACARHERSGVLLI